MYTNMQYILRSSTRMTPAFMFYEWRDRYDKNRLQEREDSPTVGFAAVKKMFKRDDMEEVSLELHSVIQATLSGALLGGLFGGFVKSRDAYINFIENNQATVYQSTKDAQRKLQDQVTIAFAKGVARWSWRVALFTGSLSLFATMVSVYRGDHSIVNYAIGGAMAGGIYKANLGLAAVVVGASLGGILGAIGGSVIIGLLKLTGVSITDIRKALYSIKEARIYHYTQAEAKDSPITTDPLVKHHVEKMKETGAVNIKSLGE